MKRACISTLDGIARCDYDALVNSLGVSHRAKESFRSLMLPGHTALSAMRDGPAHDNDGVRIACCRLLDHFMDIEALPRLIENLIHSSPGVRGAAMHALACDRCEDGTSRPAEENVLPIAIDMLLNDPDRRVRQMAADILGPSVHRSSDALCALVKAHSSEKSPTVRKIAGWWIPGAVRYVRTLKKERPDLRLSA